MHSFRSRTHILGIFTPFRCSKMSECFGWFHALSLLHLAHCENQYRVHLMQEFMQPKPFLVLSQRTCPIHYFNLKLMFWVVPWPHLTCCNNLYRGAFNARVYASRTNSFFCSKHAQSTTLGLKFKFWMVSRHFVAAPDLLWKLVSGCIKSMSLCLENHFLFRHNEHAQSTTLGLKLVSTILLDTSMHFYIAFDDSYCR